MDYQNKTILFCVINWGLGHATRSIPLIRRFARNNRVILASDGASLSLLKQEFPALEYVDMPSFEASYPHRNMILNGIQLFFKIRSACKKDRLAIKVIEEQAEVDVIISDNRFGCWSRNTHSIYITHQIQIKAPKYLGIFEPVGLWWHKKIIHRYQECWIPDIEGDDNLSGQLSHNYTLKIPKRFIGLLSRFEKPGEEVEAKYDYCILISGPEPQKTNFEHLVMEKFSSSTKRVILIRGVPETKMQYGFANFEVYNHLPAEELETKILQSNYVICRSGYTSIMDMVALRKSALLIPTPGQTEQEYLAKYLSGKGYFKHLSQNEFEKITIPELPALPKWDAV